MKIKKRPKDKKLPAIWWHDGAGQYACKIGYRDYKRANGPVRDRAFQLLGTDYEDAVRKCLELVRDWRWTVEFFKTSRPGEKPVWLEEGMMKAYQAAERGGGLNYGYEHGLIIDGGGEPEEPTCDELLAHKRRANVTLAEGVEMFLANFKSRIGLSAGKGVKLYTYLSFKYDSVTILRHIDGQSPLSRLTRSELEHFVNYWLTLPNGISVRTAVNYCKRLKQVLDWLADEESVDFVKPRGTDRLFRFRDYNPIHIEPYTNEEMKSLFGVMPKRIRLYLQLAINCGYYQSDIATLRWDHLVTLTDG